MIQSSGHGDVLFCYNGIGKTQAIWKTDYVSYFLFFKIQQGPLKISSVAEVMKESKQPATKSQMSKTEPVAPSEEKEGNMSCRMSCRQKQRLNDLLHHTC